MKKVLLSISIVILSLSLHAQEFKIGPMVGFNLSHYRISESPGLKTPPTVRLQIGVVGELGITDMFSLKSGLIIVGRGTSFKYEESNAYGSVKLDGKVKTTNIQLPLLFGVKLPLEDLGISIYTGPSIGLALGGKTKGSYWAKMSYGYGYEDYEEEESNTETLEIGNNDSDDIKSTDMGWEFAASISLDKFELPLSLSLSYTMGLTNIIPDAPSNVYMRNRSLNFTAVYYFSLNN